MLIDPDLTNSKPNPSAFYQSYLSLDEVKIGLEYGKFIKGALRINRKNYEEAYIDDSDSDKLPDILILGLQNRNRAFQDDIVAIELNDRDRWVVKDSVSRSSIDFTQPVLSDDKSRRKYCFVSDLPAKGAKIPDNKLHKTGKVVCIIQAKGSRTAVGFLKPTPDGKQNWGLFSPTDPRVPRMLVPSAQLPEGFYKRPQDFSKFLFVAEVHKWEERSKMAHAKLFQCLGKSGDIKAESAALLITYGVDTKEFPKSIEQSLPLAEGQPWKIKEEELKYRRDFRSFTVFTIDPPTARDMDDGLHIRRIKDCDGKGTKGWEVGVHIADVSYFVKPGSELDNWARNRATSFYLVEKVIPMLPRILCEELCSLNPGVDRLTFSIVWKMTANAVIQDQWIGRSIIRSCVKLSYDHAQEMIENPEKEFTRADLPQIFNDKTIAEIKESVLNLHGIAKILKGRRTENGSLRLEATKLRFALASKNGMPVGVGGDPRKEAHFLVEELMLLANMRVAEHIYNRFPDTALLRRHPPPKFKVLDQLADKLELLGYDIEFSSGKTIAESLRVFAGDENTALHIYPALTQLVLRSMQLALYFSSGVCNNCHHYALNVPLYTHFTSPIRRYPDVIVHRLLSASLGYSSMLQYSPKDLQLLCEHCNDQKTKSKSISEGSAELFFGFFIREIGQLRTVGVVIGVLDSSFDVYLVKYNIVRRVYCQQLKLTRNPDFNDDDSVLVLTWDPEYVESSDKQRPAKIKRGEQHQKDIGTSFDEADIVLDDEIFNEENEDMSSKSGESVQTITVFSTVIVLLRSIEEDSVKFSTLIEPSTNDRRLEIEEIRSILIE